MRVQWLFFNLLAFKVVASIAFCKLTTQPIRTCLSACAFLEIAASWLLLYKQRPFCLEIGSMDIQSLKTRFRHQRSITPGATTKKLSNVMGVCDRTVRRYFDLNDSAMPDIIGLAKVAEHFGVSLDAMLLPNQKLAGMPRDSRALAFGNAVYSHLAIIWFKEDLEIEYVTPAYAKLYSTTAEQMIGTNILGDWTSYAHDNYAWVPDSEGHYRKPIIETLVAVAKDAGVSTQVCWYLSPCGNIRRVLLRCFYMEDDTYLCIHVPIDDESDPIMDVDGVNKDGRFCIKFGERCRSADHYTAMHKFMSGWDVGRIAEHLGWERSQVITCLDGFRADVCAEDFDQMREIIWEWTAEGKVWDPYTIVRVNGAALK
jgi:PAS domain-containing protein